MDLNEEKNPLAVGLASVSPLSWVVETNIYTARRESRWGQEMVIERSEKQGTSVWGGTKNNLLKNRPVSLTVLDK